MIITRTPLRVSFVGGGTDQPDYYEKHTGQVVSTAIDKYIYITLNRKFDGRVHLRYSKTEEVAHADELRHTIVRECLRMFGIDGGVEIVTIADVPMHGTGLGSSSSLAVGLLQALSAFIGNAWSPEQLAYNAFVVEHERLGLPCGKQDQYAAAYGGLNCITFKQQGDVNVEGLQGDGDRACKIAWLQRSSMLFLLDVARESETVLRGQLDLMDNRLEAYDDLKGLVMRFCRWLADRQPCEAAGTLLHEAWKMKKKMCPGATTPRIDAYYAAARKAGALGGKVIGAGGGGFLLLLVPERHQPEVRKILHPLKEMPFGFNRKGSEIVYGH